MAISPTDDIEADDTEHKEASSESAASDDATRDAGATTLSTLVEEAAPSQAVQEQADLPESEPMAVSKSSSSEPTAKDDTTGPSPYGTRSRNRGSAARPNYAEDKETDEFEAQISIKAEDGKRAGRKPDHQPVTSSHTGLHTSNNRKALESAQSVADMAKDSASDAMNSAADIPPTNQPSKKSARKGAQSSGTIQQPRPSDSSNANAQNSRQGQISAPVPHGLRETAMLSFETCAARLKDGKLKADDGTILSVNDHAYLVCEPPGEPYYLGRIMEFLHVDNDRSGPVDCLRMNWYYRPKDIGRRSVDTRQIYASMHSDICPLTSLRGACEIRHKSEIPNMEEYRRQQNCFWYSQMYDRYIHRYYEVVPTSAVVNVPSKVKRVLDDRWRYILVEPGRAKELTSAVKTCKRCSQYCASNDSVDCAVCHQTYHMECVRPPLLKKPSRGFAWACGPCSRAQERKMAERNTPNVIEAAPEDDEIIEEEDDHYDGSGTGTDTPNDSSVNDTAVERGTEEQIYQASLWPYRYLGIHCRVEDALDYDDRIYPRASSRLGAKHQADVPSWPGRPFEFVKPMEIKRKYMKGGSHKKDAKLSKETIAAIEADKLAREQRPSWVVDEPAGYLERGLDLDNDDPNNTATLLYRPEVLPDLDQGEQQSHNMQKAEELIVRAEPFATKLGINGLTCVNWLDRVINMLFKNNYDIESALQDSSTLTRRDLKQPDLTQQEIKKFEDGVGKFGSELIKVKKHVKTVSPGDIVRFYYVWKKSDRGKVVWGKHPGRKGKKESKTEQSAANGPPVIKLQDEVADDYDDSAFDNDKAAEKKRGFQCKFCSTRSSRQWRRAPNTAPGTTVPLDPSNKTLSKDKSAQLIVALCISCAVVWRRYAVQWEESVDDKKGALAGGRGAKRKAEDPLREFQLSELSTTARNTDTVNTPINGTPAPQSAALVGQEPARKKLKVGDAETAGADAGPATSGQKKKPVEKAAPAVEEIPRPKTLPCAVCKQLEPLGDQHISCRDCRMSVHRNCYGATEDSRGSGKWICDMCTNDRTPQVSVQYQCVLCPVSIEPQDFLDLPKPSNKKKDREKERLEYERALRTAEYYLNRQKQLCKPENPREPLKKTSDNNWVHVACAVWTPEVKFSKAKALETAEGIVSIPSSRYEDICRICLNPGGSIGACVSCHHTGCKATVHPTCANINADYILGFDINPVKGSRRDVVDTVSIDGETVSMTAAIWCKEHAPTGPKARFYLMHEMIGDTGLNALQLYVQNFKQADLTLTGTVRKASQINQSTRFVAAAPLTTSLPSRRASTVTINGRIGHTGTVGIKLEDSATGFVSDVLSRTSLPISAARHCVTCDVDVSPRWWTYPASPARMIERVDGAEVNGTREDSIPVTGNGELSAATQEMALATAAMKVKSQPTELLNDYQCHKCHHNKVELRAPSPPKPVHIPRIAPVVPATVVAPLASPPSNVSPSIATVPASSRYWPAPVAPAFSSSHDYHNPWPRQSPGPSQPSPVIVNHYGNGGSPQLPSVSVAGLGSQATRSPAHIPQSTYMNGAIPRHNGYQHPSHRSIGGGHPMPVTSPYISHVASMPSPSHLTNGGPPLHAPEHALIHTNHAPLHRPPSSYGGSFASPAHDAPLPPHRDSRETQHMSRTARDGPAATGASASPSINNLLS